METRPDSPRSDPSSAPLDEWQSPAPGGTRDADYAPAYGDLVRFNRSRLILDAVGGEALADIARDVLDLLGTSAAVYERDGSYALGIFNSGWCRFLDEASFRLCATDDPEAALVSGVWHCHESCWSDASRTAMQEDRETDVGCSGGLRLYAVPIRAEGEVVGAINCGYGAPPVDAEARRQIAERYRVDPAELSRRAGEYLPRSPFVIDLAKHRLRTAARLIGTLVERELARRHLEESETRAGTILETSHAGIFQVDAAGLVTFANRRMTEMFRVPDQGLFGTPYSDLVHPSQRALGTDRMHRLIAGEFEAADVERLYQRADGSGFWGHLAGRRMVDAHGGFAGLVGIITDIDARKGAEMALRESEQRYRTLSEATFEGIALTDRGVFLDCNQQMADLLGATREDLIGASAADFVAPAWRKTVEEELRSGRGEPYRHEALRKDGTVFTAEVRARSVRTEGRTRQISAIRDVTPQVREEEQLRSSERRFRSLVESMQEGVCLHELVRDTRGRAMDYRILEVNEAYEQILEIPAARAVGSLGSELYGSGSAPFLEIYARVADSGVPERFEVDFAPLEKHFSISVFRPAQDRFATVFMDVSESRRAEEERGRLEEQIRHVQKLESLGVLAGGIAHDFNNILMAILGNADLARTELPTSSPVRAYVSEIERASRRAADLCRQMLAYSGKGRFVVEKVDLSQIVREMAEMLEISVSKKATLRYDFSGDLPPVEVDVTQVRQIVMNLITNASEAVGDGTGVITVSSGVMHCDRSYLAESYLDERLQEGRYVFLEVSDTGCGMSAETRGKIFDPFFSTKFTGRGLGLAAVLGIVRGHRGAIKVYSESGRGTAFKVLLPAVSGEAAALPQWDGSPARWIGEGTVLLADDEEAVRTVGEKMLEHLGFEVAVAADGRQALEMFAQDPNRFDCVLLDLMMPHMGGEEAFRELRRLRPDVRVILSSGYNEQEVTQKFAGKGLAGFVQKPYSLKRLEEVLQSVFAPAG